MTHNPEERTACALRYAKFLMNVDQHSAHGIDTHTLEWLNGSGFGELSALTAEEWSVVKVVLVHLAIHGALKITTLLEGLIYRVWQLCLSVVNTEEQQAISVFLDAANSLCHVLMAQDATDSEAHGNTPRAPGNLLEWQQLRTYRNDVFREEHYRPLLRAIPDLVHLENNEAMDDVSRMIARDLRLAICSTVDFKLGAVRYLDAVLDTFSKSIDPERTQDNMHEPLVKALRLLFDDVDCGESTLISFTSILR